MSYDHTRQEVNGHAPQEDEFEPHVAAICYSIQDNTTIPFPPGTNPDQGEPQVPRTHHGQQEHTQTTSTTPPQLNPTPAQDLPYIDPHLHDSATAQNPSSIDPLPSNSATAQNPSSTDPLPSNSATARDPISRNSQIASQEHLDHSTQQTDSTMDPDDDCVQFVRDQAIQDGINQMLQQPEDSFDECYAVFVKAYLQEVKDTNLEGYVTRMGLDVAIVRQLLEDLNTPEILNDVQTVYWSEFCDSIVTQSEVFTGVWEHVAHGLKMVLDDPAVAWREETLGNRLGRYMNVEVKADFVSAPAPVAAAVAAPPAAIVPPPVGTGPIAERRLANGVTRWATTNDGVDFGEHEPGVGFPWKCLLCQILGTVAHFNSKGGLKIHLVNRHGVDRSDLVSMVVVEGYANHEGWDDLDLFMWGEYVHGDPLPFKCRLCPNHKGIKYGSGAYPRQFKLTHGIKVVLPPVGAAAEARHRRNKERSGVQQRQLDAIAQLRAAAAAPSSAGVRRSAEGANLDEEELVEDWEPGWAQVEEEEEGGDEMEVDG